MNEIGKNEKPEKCPQCGSSRLIRKVKGTFQYDGWTCVDCLAHIPECEESRVMMSKRLHPRYPPGHEPRQKEGRI